MMSSFPYIFTFYSYKGGVGRSLALVNCAYALAGRGRHVLVVDMDLEAPGISGFLHRNKELAEPEATHPKDVLDLLWECIAAVKEGKKPAEIASSLPPVSAYSRPVAAKKLDGLAPSFGELGRLDFLVVDESRDYWSRLAELGLQGLPQDQLIALSTTLHHYFKSQRFSHRLFGMEPFDPPTQTPYDYVLVDSRTGITEVGGLCVGPLADRLVVVTGLNDQNVHGTLSFFKEAGINPVARTGADEPWDKADTPGADGATQPNLGSSLGPKPTLIVASPVPSGEIQLKQQRVWQLAELLKIRPIQLSYHPQLGLIESIFVRDYPEEQLSFNYVRLADNLMARVQDHPSQLAFQISKLWNAEKRPLDSVECVLRLASHDPRSGLALLMQLASALETSADRGFILKRRLYAFLSQSPREIKPLALYNWGVALYAEAKTERGAEAFRLFEAAGQKFAEALRIKPDYHDALGSWGDALTAQANTEQGAEADQLFEAAGQKFADALRIKPDYHQALGDWGEALSGQAATKRGPEADRLFEAAGQKYAEALRIKPDSHEALYNWGNALSAQAKTEQGAEAFRLFEAAGQKYAEALRIKPDKHEALYNWGSTLCAQAMTKQGAEADQLFEVGAQKFAEAARIKPDKHEALQNWGNALCAQATTKQGAEAERLFEAGAQKFAEAARIKPDSHEALNNCGNALSAQAKNKQGPEADRVLEAAGKKFAEALRIKPDSHDALYGWGNALSAQARTKQGAEADRLSEAAGQKYAEALRIKPGSHDALYCWGVALLAQAKTKEGAEADRLFVAAGQRYAEALRIKPDSHDALYGWGVALLAQAKTKEGAGADRLFEAGAQKFAEALRIKPESHDALCNWGVALLGQARTKQGAEADQLFEAARQKLLAAEQLQSGPGAYGLACLEARQGSAENAVSWLRQGLKSGLPLSRGEIAQELDFDRVRNDPIFQTFLQSLPPG